MLTKGRRIKTLSLRAAPSVIVRFMDFSAFAWSAALSLLPISELRGGIPFAYFSGGMPLWLASLWCLAWNASVAVLGFVLLNTVHTFMSRFAWYAKIFEALLGRARRKLHGGVEKYGYWGILFSWRSPSLHRRMDRRARRLGPWHGDRQSNALVAGGGIAHARS